jgi:hypothetical protein
MLAFTAVPIAVQAFDPTVHENIFAKAYPNPPPNDKFTL